MKERRIYGPPGTGKTTRLATNEIPRAVDKYGADKVMVVSFTRAAAMEIATKRSLKTGLPIELPQENVGTLHSICYHALKTPQIIETEKKHITEWNLRYPNNALSGHSISKMDDLSCEGSQGGGPTSYPGDKLLNTLNIKRNKMINPKFWTLDLQHFNKNWIEFKNEINIYDFTDLIEESLKTMPYAPGHPEVLFVDEAQDMTKLQLTLIRSWGQQMEWIVLIGDDDQTIYRFTGASPDAFLNPPIEAKMKIVLDQSYRVPRKILERANDLIHKVKHREPKIYSPRIDTVTKKEVAGAIHQHRADWRYPNELIDLIEKYDNKSIMFLTSCSYMLAPLIRELRSRGLPFHNPYRKVRGDWNPLQASGTGISSKEMLINFLDSGIDEKFWNVIQFVNWVKYLKVGEKNSGIKRKVGKVGIKRLSQAIDDNEPGLHTSRNVLSQILTEKGIKNALNRNIEWLMDHLPHNRYETMQYPFKIFKKNGYDALKKIPLIIPGTIHSVKGAEADIVVLFPDISQQAQSEIDSSVEGFDSVIRTFYVGMTRARQELIITSPAVKYKRMKPRLFIEL